MTVYRFMCTIKKIMEHIQTILYVYLFAQVKVTKIWHSQNILKQNILKFDIIKT